MNAFTPSLSYSTFTTIGGGASSELRHAIDLRERRRHFWRGGTALIPGGGARDAAASRSRPAAGATASGDDGPAERGADAARASSRRNPRIVRAREGGIRARRE
eukprot:30921-Pelagococcus_subviridis.AAC.8